MSLTKEGYIPRLIDDKMLRYLDVFGSVSIEGTKGVGKTWTGLNHAESVQYLTDKGTRNLAKIDPKYIFTKEHPELIDEWQIVPAIWDAVRHECDSDQEKGKFILTGSTALRYSENDDDKVYHTGTGRIATLRMHPMSLYESGDSTGRASISDMLEGKVDDGYERNVELDELAYYIMRGGWPSNRNVPERDALLIPESYIESIVTKDMHEREKKKRNPDKMRKLIKSLSRNESTLTGLKTIVRDVEEYESGGGLIESTATARDYLSVLESLYITSDVPAYSLNYRSSSRIVKSAKRHLEDPSLCCASLGLTLEKLMYDHETFGMLFEALAVRDLRIYAEYLDGRLYHFRDNVSKDEVDAIIEFRDGSYAAFEIKLSAGSINDAVKSLERFRNSVQRKPIFSCIIVGHQEAVIRKPDSGIYIVPLTSLKP